MLRTCVNNQEATGNQDDKDVVAPNDQCAVDLTAVSDYQTTSNEFVVVSHTMMTSDMMANVTMSEFLTRVRVDDTSAKTAVGSGSSSGLCTENAWYACVKSRTSVCEILHESSPLSEPLYTSTHR